MGPSSKGPVSLRTGEIWTLSVHIGGTACGNRSLAAPSQGTPRSQKKGLEDLAPEPSSEPVWPCQRHDLSLLHPQLWDEPFPLSQPLGRRCRVPAAPASPVTPSWILPPFAAPPAGRMRTEGGKKHSAAHGSFSFLSFRAQQKPKGRDMSVGWAPIERWNLKQPSLLSRFCCSPESKVYTSYKTGVVWFCGLPGLNVLIFAFKRGLAQ